MPQTALAEEVPEKVIPLKTETTYKLKGSRLEMGMEGQRMRSWLAVPEAGTPYEALFNPVYWDIHGYKFAPGDMIRVEPDEGHYTADLRVVASGVGGVRVAEYYKKDWDKVSAPATLASQFRVRHAGPHHMWRVERIADGHIEQAHFQNESLANSWLAENLKELSAAAKLA